MANNYACDMNALTKEQRLRHSELAKLLHPEVVRFIELPNGYSAEIGDGFAEEVNEFCKLEILCCPFFELEVSDLGEKTMLSITGNGEIKPFIRAEFGIPSGEAPDA
ncbi:MAG: hypothetical protein AB8B86_15220 [Pseudomonadales bacterium]